MTALEPRTPEQEWQPDPGGDVVRSHYSALTLHRKCPQAWYYRYGLKLRAPSVGPDRWALDAGSWWGALRTAEALERGRHFDSLLAKPRVFRPVDSGPEFDQKTVTAKEVYQALVSWWDTCDLTTKEKFVEKLGDELPKRIRDAFVRWQDRWREERKNERPLGVEIFWERELVRPEADAAWEGDLGPMPSVHLLGFIDEAYFDEQKGMVCIRDNKFTSGIGTQSLLDDMMDSQLQLYAWGAEPLFRSWGIEPARVISYDRTKSTAATTPQLTQGGSLSKTVTMFDLRTYLEWAKVDTRPDEEELLKLAAEKGFAKVDDDGNVIGIDEEDYRTQLIRDLPEGRVYGALGDFFVTGAKRGQPKFGVYQVEQDVINRITTPAHMSAFHQRQPVPISRHVQRAHLRAALDSATDIWRTQRRAELVLEAARNMNKDNCRWCDYASLCRAQMVGGPVGQYELVEHGLSDDRGSVYLEIQMPEKKAVTA